MILVIKPTTFEQLPDGRLRITAGVEDLKEALSAHSPNILVDYLNERYNAGISPISHKRKEARNG